MPVGSSAAVITGRVVDAETGLPLPYATIRVEGTGKSVITNERGIYRLILPAGAASLQFSHIGYLSAATLVDLEDSLKLEDIALTPVLLEVPGIVVTPEGYSREQLMIEKAITRRQEMMKTLRNLRYDCYLKEVWRDRSKDSARNIFLILESQVTCWWQYPDKYRELLRMRRQPKSIPAEINEITLGNILDVYRDRIETDGGNIVSPVASDALKHYDYFLVDSTFIDSRRLYSLLVVPRNERSPSFEGRIDVIDSTFDLARADLQLNKAARERYVRETGYLMQCAPFDNGYWLPIMLHLYLEASLLFPGLPRRISIDVLASIHNHEFGDALPEIAFDTPFELDPAVDTYDSTAWAQGQTIPLTVDEADSYARIDSVGVFGGMFRDPLFLGLVAAPLLLTGSFPEIFHFNRVEGAYVGISLPPLKIARTTRLWWAVGYAFDAELWQYKFELTHRFLDRGRLEAFVGYRREVTPIRLTNKGLNNSTVDSYLLKKDPLDYLRQSGFHVKVRAKPARRVSSEVSFSSYQQKSLSVNSDFSVLFPNRVYRDNEPIEGGTLRTIDLRLTYDFRKTRLYGDREFPVTTGSYSKLDLRWMVSSDKVLRSDFEFSRLEIALWRFQRLSRWGDSWINVRAGNTFGTSIPQARFIFANGTDFVRSGDEFLSLGNERLSVDRYGSLYVKYDVPTESLKWSPLRPLSSILTLPRVQGGALWAERDTKKVTEAGATLSGWSYEVGVGLGLRADFFPFFEPRIFYTRNFSDARKPSDFVLFGASL